MYESPDVVAVPFEPPEPSAGSPMFVGTLFAWIERNTTTFMLIVENHPTRVSMEVSN